jgi:hypothetical protein
MPFIICISLYAFYNIEIIICMSLFMYYLHFFICISINSCQYMHVILCISFYTCHYNYFIKWISLYFMHFILCNPFYAFHFLVHNLFSTFGWNFCELGAQAKFKNPMTNPSRILGTGWEKEEEEERKKKEIVACLSCSTGRTHFAHTNMYIMSVNKFANLCVNMSVIM